MKRARFALALCGAILLAGCLSNQNVLFVKGEPFIISGTAATVNRTGPCLVWYGENGFTYQLFQGARVANEDFDRVTTPGVTSRLEISTRSDLQVACQVGTIVEVQRVLEIVD